MSSDVQLFLKRGSSAEAARRESQHLQDLAGCGIVPLRDADAQGLRLERAACSLADVLHERGPLPEGEVRAVGAAAAAALARVHATGLVHGDIKPANLLLSHQRELWLADFDAARPADGGPLERFSPGRQLPGTAARFDTDVSALALALIELSTGMLLDPGMSWHDDDLRRLGCPKDLSTELSCMLNGNDIEMGAGRAARLLAQGGIGSLPAPVANAHRADSTPTVEFMPARPPPDPSPRPSPVTSSTAPRWWQRLAKSWRPSDATVTPGGQRGVQASGKSQASRSL